MKLSRRRLLWSSATVALGATGYRLARGFDDSSADIEQVPPSLRRAGLDVHVHVMGVGTLGTGCWMSPATRSSLNARIGLWNLRLRIGQPDLDQAYVAYLLSRVRSAGFLKQVVLLAQDWTYTDGGERDESRTAFHTPNEYIARLASEYREFLFGASIHPYRPDAVDALDQAVAQGTVLMKWIPSVQAIRLDDQRSRVFYRRLVQHGIPLLAHIGEERSVNVAGQEYGDPAAVVAPLEEGVTVIAAHVASLGQRDGRSNFDRLADLFPKWPNLYADTSALTLYTRWRVLLRLVERTELHARLIHGSDFPLPPAATLFAGRIPSSRWWSAWKHENGLRRDFEIKQALGLPEQIYTRGYEVLGRRAAAGVS
jgi:predicted TIM-barrel fold metal-dependent hydrolase